MKQKHKYLLQRFALMVVSIWAVATILFLLFRFSPGDPANKIVNPYFPEEQRQRMLRQFGLTDPLHIQYIKYMGNLATGNFGVSFQNQRPVLPFILNRALNTLAYTLPALTFTFIVGPVLGALFSSKRNGPLDTYGTGFFMAAFATPVFWSGMLALMLFSFSLGWFPSGGIRSPTYVENSMLDRFFAVDFLRHLALPLSVYAIARVSRPLLIMRNNMTDVLGEDFIELKKAEGLSPTNVLYRHAARNSLLPVVHYAALAFGFAMGGAIALEKVFSWPGLGRALWSAIEASDYPVAQGGFILISTMVFTMNFLVDIFSVYIDPRISDESGGGDV